jgi:hypothetical protein
MGLEHLKISQIRCDGDTHARVEMNAEVVQRYAEAMQAGARFPAPVVFFDGEYWLAGGFYTVAAQFRP